MYKILKRLRRRTENASNSAQGLMRVRGVIQECQLAALRRRSGAGHLQCTHVGDKRTEAVSGGTATVLSDKI